jgi:hypothetical protein
VTDHLTQEQIELLRSLPQDRVPIESGPELLGLAESVFKSDVSEDAEWVRTPAADLLLATIDSLEAEREGEVKLAGEYQGGYCVDGETQITVAAVTTSEDINNRKAFESLHAGPCEITIRPIKEGGEEA